MTARLIGALALLAALVGLYGYAHHQGAASVQAKWDAANAVATATASEAARATEQAQAGDFAGIESTYLKATSHAYPSLADALPAAVAAGTVQLRDACPAPDTRGLVSEATARSRAADAAATQALADRIENSIAAVRAGEAADVRERELDAHVIALQGLLQAERKTP